MSDRIEVGKENKEHSEEEITVSAQSPESSDTTQNNDETEEENNHPIQVDYKAVDAEVESIPQLLEVEIDTIIRFD